MTLLESIKKKFTKKVKTAHAIYENNLSSPPPELEKIVFRPKKIRRHKYKHVGCKVEARPPLYCPGLLSANLSSYTSDYKRLYHDNIDLVTSIRRMDYIGGLVDCRWKEMPRMNMQYYHIRKNFINQLHYENKIFYKRILETGPKVDTTERHARDWKHNRREIVSKAKGQFILFPPVPTEDIEDSAFVAAHGIKRPRVYIELGIKNGAKLGTLQLELFSDVCPKTCKLFLDLIHGDGVGYGYIGTQFFRKVPQLFWCGGDVVFDNGFGCYAQRGRRMPIRAENYHFSHSMPGLLSMQMTCDDEMCGIFNITFKPLTQFDLRSVVFGRVIRPSSTFEVMKSLGSALSVQPVVEISSTRYRRAGKWLCGEPNKRLVSTVAKRFYTR